MAPHDLSPSQILRLPDLLATYHETQDPGRYAIMRLIYETFGEEAGTYEKPSWKLLILDRKLPLMLVDILQDRTIYSAFYQFSNDFEYFVSRTVVRSSSTQHEVFRRTISLWPTELWCTLLCILGMSDFLGSGNSYICVVSSFGTSYGISAGLSSPWECQVMGYQKHS